MTRRKRTPLTGDALRAALRTQVTITLVWHDADAPPGEGCDAECVAWIREELRRGNEWAWFDAEVRATYAGFTGIDYLGACSYRSEADFRQPGGYFDDMVTAAIDAIATEIEAAMGPHPRLTAARAALASLGEVRS